MFDIGTLHNPYDFSELSASIREILERPLRSRAYPATEIRILSVDPSQMRYNTVGDWFYHRVGANVELVIMVADTGSSHSNFLLAIHELIEAFLCFGRVSAQEIDFYDAANPEAGSADLEANMYSPYAGPHNTATSIEYLLTQAVNGQSAGIFSWPEHCQNLSETQIILDKKFNTESENTTE